MTHYLSQKDQSAMLLENSPLVLEDGIHPDRLARMETLNTPRTPIRTSEIQQKKRAALEPRPPPLQPIVPDKVPLPKGEEDRLALSNLPSEQLEKEVIREKRRKAAERKAFRLKQKSGKEDRRVARDEKRRVYRKNQLVWKSIKGVIS